MIESSRFPLVSYVLLSFNHARFVRQAIDSILAQDYPALELIVVDDGSTDGSRELLRALSAEKGFLLVEKENGGVVSAINTGVPLAKGAFIVPHASDDVSHPGRTRAQVDLLRQMPEAGMVAGGIRKISENGAVLAASPGAGRKVYRFEDFRTGRASIPAVSCMYRAEAIRDALPLDEKICFEDVQLFWRVTERGWTCVHDDSVVAVDYRIITASLGRKSKVKLWRDFMAFLDRYRDREWHHEAYRRACAGLFVQLAIDEKKNALRFVAEHFRDIDAIALLRGGLLWCMPAEIAYRLRKKY